MAKIARIALIVSVPLLILFLPLVVYVVDVSANEGTVARNVSVMGIDVSGMTQEEALIAVGAYEQALRAEPAVFVVNGVSFELAASDAGLAVNTEEMVAEAMVQRQNSLLGGFMPWMKSFNDDIDLPLTATVDGDIIDEHLALWEEQAVTEPAFEGAIEVVAGRVEFEYPRDGLRMDRETSRELVEVSLLSLERDTVELPVLDIDTQLGEADIDEAVATVEKLIARPVTLRHDLGDEATGGGDEGDAEGEGDEEAQAGQVLEFVMQPDQMAAAVRVDIVEETPAHIEIDLDDDVVDSYLEPKREDLETRPTQLVIHTNVANNAVSVVPGEAGTAVDAADVAPALYDAALAVTVGELPVTEGEQPRYTDEDIEAWGPLGRVSDFTTYHPSGQPRVTNIQLMARTVDETIVWPGETFSINAIVGQRTEAKGYVRDGAIINGEVSCCDEPANVGGGVSQFATTMYNAAFFGCYEDIEHAPHSIYFSRYPEGREATLGYEHPDVKFRNDSDAPVIVRTGYTSGSITVKLFGNNGGRKCRSESSERHNFTEPRVLYEENPNVSGGPKLVKNGTEGWSITITRVMTMPDGSVIREPYTHHYRGSVKKFYVRSCATAPGSATCTKPPPEDLPPPTTEAPATTAAPGTTEAPATTQAPETTATTQAPETTATTQAPETTATTQAPETTTTTVEEPTPPPPTDG